MALHALPVEMNMHVLAVAFSLLATYVLFGLVCAKCVDDERRLKVRPANDRLKRGHQLLDGAPEGVDEEIV